MASDVHLFGIRHHGPGSARSLVAVLAKLDPDIVLVEGPPEANEIVALASRDDLTPPVAILVYAVDAPRCAVIYPFARFSPEWQAIRFGVERGRPVRFIDLPQSARLGDGADSDAATESAAPADVLAPLALAAGYADAERWWDHLVETRAGDDTRVFAALHELMREARAELDPDPALEERRREAHMRRAIRAARAEGFARIAVVCGAYHTPALAELPSAREDDALLRALPRRKTASVWVPWSYERLAGASGYGAGIESPMFYELLWEGRDGSGAGWMTRAARLMRNEDLPASSAHAIEACRLAEALAALRGRAVPGLPEYNDAAVAILAGGEPRTLAVIGERWHYDGRLGAVPADFPAAPLQQDLAATQKRLRLRPSLEEKQLDLDLRTDIDRERSQLLRRLRILDIDWGTPTRGSAGKGTFHELWLLRWRPEFAVLVIDASRFGHTVASAAAACVIARTAEASLPELVVRLEDVLFASLPEAIGPLVAAIENRAALAADVLQLLDALPPLVDVQRYGNVRGTDVGLVAEILAGLFPRIVVGIGPASRNIDDDAARRLWAALRAAQQALTIWADANAIAAWHEALGRLAADDATQPLLAGYAHRLLYDARVMTFDELALALTRALSLGADPTGAASWVEGLLSGSGTLLIHDDRLRAVLEAWVSATSEPNFLQVLPLLRRTFATFTAAERRVLGQRIAAGAPASPSMVVASDADFDQAAADAVLATLAQMWTKRA